MTDLTALTIAEIRSGLAAKSFSAAVVLSEASLEPPGTPLMYAGMPASWKRPCDDSGLTAMSPDQANDSPSLVVAMRE